MAHQSLRITLRPENSNSRAQGSDDRIDQTNKIVIRRPILTTSKVGEDDFEEEWELPKIVFRQHNSISSTSSLCNCPTRSWPKRLKLTVSGEVVMKSSCEAPTKQRLGCVCEAEEASRRSGVLEEALEEVCPRAWRVCPR